MASPKTTIYPVLNELIGVVVLKGGHPFQIFGASSQRKVLEYLTILRESTNKPTLEERTLTLEVDSDTTLVFYLKG